MTTADVTHRGWRSTVSAAADLALLGVLVTGAALPLVTAGAAVTTGSAAVRHHLDHDAWPSLRFLWDTFRRSLLPGLAGSALLAVVALLVVAEVLAVRAGVVPGGWPLAAALLVTAGLAAGFAGLVVVAAPEGTPWARAFSLARARPGQLVAAAGVVVLVVFLVALVHPVLTPVLVGYGLFALHVVARHGSVRHGSVRHGSVRSGGVRSGGVRSGSVRPGSVRPGGVRSGTTGGAPSGDPVRNPAVPGSTMCPPSQSVT
ncbi:hypothetical protein [Actinoplanes sp. NPDC051494]|uniref:hypothetical protein n=1 Tax=Actinoplanes sp. NPDC051494 TaxID=3363907 RepID=UPI0037B75A3E